MPELGVLARSCSRNSYYVLPRLFLGTQLYKRIIYVAFQRVFRPQSLSQSTYFHRVILPAQSGFGSCR